MNNLDHLPNDGARFREDNRVRFKCSLCGYSYTIDLMHDGICPDCYVYGQENDYDDTFEPQDNDDQ